MGNIITATMALTAMVGLVCGCDKDDGGTTVRTNSTYVVVVGMENSKMAGRCDGAGMDAERMYNLLSRYTPNIVKFRDNQATKSTVVNALKQAIDDSKDDGLVIFFYSGHGGSDPFSDTGMEETDGKDEYLLLWDTYLRDNEIWNIISKSKSRVMMVVDACHSQSIMRSSGFSLNPPLAWDHNMSDNVNFSLLCWSGCPDDTYSYGSSSGGQFTNALLRHFNGNKTYEQLWNEIKNDKTLRSYENPQSTVIGKGFEGKEVFR